MLGVLTRATVTAALAVLFMFFLMGPRGSLWPAEKVRVSNLTATTLQDAIDTGELSGGGAGQICKTIEVPASNEEFYTIYRAPADLTFSEIYCEVLNGTSVGIDFEIDSGSIDAVHGSDVPCDTDGETESSLGGTVAMSAGDRLDLDLGTVVGDVDLLSACIEFTFD